MKPIRHVAVAAGLLCSLTLASHSAQAACSGSATNMTCTGTGGSLTQTNASPGPTTSPYPFTDSVSGLNGSLASVTVQLNGFTHSDPEDLAFVLVAPDGATNLVFMSGTDGFNGTTNATLTFSDSATGLLVDYGDDPIGNAKTGTFKPTSATLADSTNQDYSFGSPAPARPNFSAPRDSHTLNGVFGGLSGSSLNGVWKLFVNDTFGTSGQDSGTLSSFSLTITTSVSAVGTTTTASANPAQVFTSAPGNTTTVTATVTSSGTPVTAGTVAFTDNGAAISGAGAVVLNGSGQASFSYSAAAGEGMHTIQANYGGAPGFDASQGETGLEVDNHPAINGQQVCNGPITLGGFQQPSKPYGSRLYVPSSFAGSLSSVTLFLNGLTSPDASSFALLLTSPGGGKFIVPMDEIGFNSGSIFSVSGVNLQLTDAAGSLMPMGAQLTSGTFLPTAYLLNNNLTVFPAPAPVAGTNNYAAPTGNPTFASTFGGLDPVGTAPNNFWELFATNVTGEPASIASWCLTFVTTSAPGSQTTVSSSENPAFVGDNVVFTATVKSNGNPVTAGTVTFRDGATTLQGPTALTSSGTVTFASNSLTEGTHTIEALYSGAAGVANVSSGSLSEEVDNHTQISNNNLTFCNPGAISMPNQSSASTPYPSRIFVSNVPGTVGQLLVQLNNFTRPDPSGTAVLLAGPQIQNNSQPENLVLFSEAGGSIGNATFPVANANLVFEDGHAPLPQFGPIVSGLFGTSFYNTFGGSIVFAAPAPISYNSSGTLASAFGGSNPNGTWQLFPDTEVKGFGDGSFSSWCLTFAENAPALTVTKTASGTFLQGATGGQFTISVKNNGPGATGGTTPVKVTDNLPTGMTATAITANNWSCTSTLPSATVTCSRSDALQAGTSYADSIVVTVAVAANAPTGNVMNTATVAGGGSANNLAGSATVNVLPAPVQITFTTSPAGLPFSVDGVTFTAATSQSLAVGSSHTVATTSPQTSAGTQFTFNHWSDSGAISHSIVVPGAAATFTAFFDTAFLLTTVVNPTAAGTVTPASGQFFAASSVVNLIATPSHGFQFSSWTGPVANGSAAATTVTMTGPQTVTANFASKLTNVTSSVSVTGSGLVYNRVAKRFIGSITVKNISGAALIGPLQLGLLNLPAGVTLANATTTFNGAPFITIPGGLTPGQAATVQVQFSDPSNTNINYQTAVYSGAF